MVKLAYNIFFSLSLLAPLAVQAQYEIPSAKRALLIDNAYQTVRLYQYNLVSVGSEAFETYEKGPFKVDIIEQFDASDVQVYNDIDPSGKEAEYISISTYLGNITNNYNKYGVQFTTTMDESRSGTLYEDTRNHEFLFTKIVAERTVKGRSNNHDSIYNKLWIDIYLQFTINDEGDIDQNAYIYSIRKHEDNASEFTPVLITGGRQQVVQKVTPSANEQTTLPCGIPNRDPSFNGSASSDTNWETFYTNSSIYKDAIEDGVSGNAIVDFTVNTDGSIQESSINIQLVEVSGSQSAVKKVVEQLVMASADHEEGWNPGTIDCKPAAKKVSGMRIKFSSTPCHAADHRPWLNGSGKEASDAAWKDYISKSEVYRKAVMDDKVWEEVRAEFNVKATGQIDSSSIRVFAAENAPVPDLIKTINGVVKQLVLQSNSFGNGWIPALVNCENTDGKVTRIIKFNKRSVATGSLTPEGRIRVPVEDKPELSEKEQRKVDWKKWKEEHKGGVHFSVGGGYTSAISNDHQGGFFQAAFGALFSHFVGMELSYQMGFYSVLPGRYNMAFNQDDGIRDFTAPKDGELYAHNIGLGFIFNTSKGRVRPYFPLRVGVSISEWKSGVGVVSGLDYGTFGAKTKIGWFISAGLGFDFKLGNYVSLYFAAEVMFDETVYQGGDVWIHWRDSLSSTDSNDRFSTRAFSISPTAGLRFTRW